MESFDVKGDEGDDWFHESDLEENVPVPINDPQALFQSQNKLPELLTRKHFLEG